MEITLTRKILIEPSEEQEILLKSTAQAYTDACNYISAFCFREHTTSKKNIQESLYYDLREHFNLPSQMAISAIRSVVSAYATVHATQKRWSVQPAFKKQKYNLTWNRDYSLNRKTGDFSLNTLDGRQHIKTQWKGQEKYSILEKYGTATIAFKHGKWFAHIPVSITVDELSLDDVVDIMGIDLGVNFLATTYSSTTGKTQFFSGKHIKHKRAQYRNLRSELQRKGTRSSRKRLKAIGNRENRWMSDINHTITKALVNTTNPTLFVLEDLSGIRSATEKVRTKDRYVQVSWAFYDFRKKLEYKAQLHGHKVLIVDPRYTSQMCPKCGYTHKKNRNKKTHTFCCTKCGYCSNDDRIAAMNLCAKGIQYRAQFAMSKAPSEGESHHPHDVPTAS